MTDTDDLLRDLTSDVEDATPMAVARMRADVLRRIDPAPRPRWRRPARLVPLAGGLAAAAIGAALVVSTGGGGPSLVQRAEAAVTPPGEIVHIVAGYRGVGDQAGSIEATRLEDWSLAGEDGSLRMRRFISSGPSTRAPDDEDTVLELDAAGRITRAASWTPDDRISLGFPAETTPYANSWAGLLSKAYRDGRLKDAGTTGDGLRVLDGNIDGLQDDDRDGCAPHQRVALDPASFEPRWMDLSWRCGAEDEPEVRIEFTVDRLPATPANLDLLEIGPWPVTTAVRVAPDGSEAPVPVSQARREAGMD